MTDTTNEAAAVLAQAEADLATLDVTPVAVLKTVEPVGIMRDHKETAALFGMSVDTLTRLRDAGAVQGYKPGGRGSKVYYDLAEVRAAMVALPNAKTAGGW